MVLVPVGATRECSVAGGLGAFHTRGVAHGGDRRDCERHTSLSQARIHDMLNPAVPRLDRVERERRVDLGTRSVVS
jgi:hypothetical protein